MILLTDQQYESVCVVLLSDRGYTFRRIFMLEVMVEMASL